PCLLPPKNLSLRSRAIGRGRVLSATKVPTIVWSAGCGTSAPATGVSATPPPAPWSGKYDLTGSVTNTSGSRYSGTVVGGSEGSRETGRVFLIQRGKLLSVSVTSRSGSARMTLFKLG